jgi:hypothetical protein
MSSNGIDISEFMNNVDQTKSLPSITVSNPHDERTIVSLNNKGDKNNVIQGIEVIRPNESSVTKTNGVTNGVTNGITNGVTKMNGVTNGVTKMNGVTNGVTKMNGVTNGVTKMNGVTNGVTKMNGVTKTNGIERKPSYSSSISSYTHNPFKVPVRDEPKVFNFDDLTSFINTDKQKSQTDINIDNYSSDNDSIRKPADTPRSNNSYNPNYSHNHDNDNFVLVRGLVLNLN